MPSVLPVIRAVTSVLPSLLYAADAPEVTGAVSIRSAAAQHIIPPAVFFIGQKFSTALKNTM